jgi:hypothetical protein
MDAYNSGVFRCERKAASSNGDVSDLSDYTYGSRDQFKPYQQAFTLPIKCTKKIFKVEKIPKIDPNKIQIVKIQKKRGPNPIYSKVDLQCQICNTIFKRKLFLIQHTVAKKGDCEPAGDFVEKDDMWWC